MEVMKCEDRSISNAEGAFPPCRRIIDYDFCHSLLSLKYAAEHSCTIGSNIKLKAMDVDYVRKYFETNPSGTPAGFRDFAINQAMNENANVNEIAMQYADLVKIKNIQAQLKKEKNPDGSGMTYLEQLAKSLINNKNIDDKFLLEVDRNTGLIALSSEERMRIAKSMSMAKNDDTESVSVDFCESLFKDYSLMSVTTYSGSLRQLVPIFQAIFPKPGESADNVEKALMHFDDMMQRRYGIDFEPCYWTSDNSGAIENGILRVKGETMKCRLGSDKLHDENNLKRVILTLPSKIQESIESELRLMVNSICPEVSEKIFEQISVKAKDMGYDKLYRSLQFNYRKRHKYWNCYREVLDNNATTEQTNRMQTRHNKSVSLIEGDHP